MLAVGYIIHNTKIDIINGNWQNIECAEVEALDRKATLYLKLAPYRRQSDLVMNASERCGALA